MLGVWGLAPNGNPCCCDVGLAVRFWAESQSFFTFYLVNAYSYQAHGQSIMSFLRRIVTPAQAGAGIHLSANRKPISVSPHIYYGGL